MDSTTISPLSPNFRLDSSYNERMESLVDEGFAAEMPEEMALISPVAWFVLGEGTSRGLESFWTRH